MTMTNVHVADRDTERPTIATRVARVITEVAAPAILAATMPLVIALHASTNWITGVKWGTLALLFSSAIPYTIVRIGIHIGRLGDHHLSDRAQRRTPVLLGLASVLIGLLLMIGLGAPRELIAMVALMLAVLFGIGLVNLKWKLSAHAAVASGSTTALTMTFGPALLATAPLVLAIAWSRVKLRDHTPAQVIVGAMLGAVVAAFVYTAVR